MKKISFTLLALVALLSASAQHLSSFDDLGLNPNSYWNGSNLSGGFLDGDVFFNNHYDTTYYYWSGFAYSNIKINVDTITSSASDYSYQYSNASGSGANGSGTFGLAYAGGDAVARLKGFATGHQVYGLYVTNSTYDYVSMTYGDAFAKKFGGATGTDPDWFRLTIGGWYNGAPIANTVDVYLADFRSATASDHYIQKDWKFVNLLTLGNVDSLSFTLNSSDTAGGFGMNTPAYFALDNLITTDGVTYAPPVAVNDSFAFTNMDTLTGNADTLHANILANDTISSRVGISVSLVSGPLVPGAVAYLDSNFNLIYIPATGIQTYDTLIYSLCDALGSCDTAVVVVFSRGPLNTGIHNLDNPNLHIYPNPASTHVSITYSSPISVVSVTDMSGREVTRQEYDRSAALLNVASLSPGVYSILICTQDGTVVKRLVKE